MALRWDRVAIRTDDRCYTWRDALALAALQGGLRSRVVLGEQRELARRNAEERGLGLSTAERDALASRFRYEHDLISGEEAERWLEAVDLDRASWMKALERSEIATRASAKDVREQITLSPDDARNLLWEDALCSGWLRGMGIALAERVAIWGEWVEGRGDDSDVPELASEVDSLVSDADAEFARWVDPGEEPEREAHERLRGLAECQAIYTREFERPIREAQLESAIHAHAIEWTRLEVSRLGFGREGMAREALLRATDDGQGFEQIAHSLGQPSETHRLYLEDFLPEERDALLSARIGEIAGPLRVGKEFVLYSVLAKHRPTPASEGIRVRARRWAFERRVALSVEQRVRWTDDTPAMSPARI
jgi:hypothetical protein